MHFIFRMHAHAPYGASRSAESIQVCLFPRRKAGELRSSLPRGRAPLKVDGHAIQSLFDRPQGEAANQLGISITAMKQVCRKLDIVRWPYRRKKKAESARAAHTSLAAARKASAVEACSSVCPSVDAFEPAHTPRSVVSSASTRADSANRVDSQSPAGQDGCSATSKSTFSPPPSPPRNCGAYVRLSADRLRCHMADLDMEQAQKYSPLDVVCLPTAGPTCPQPESQRSNTHWIPSPCDHQWLSVARARPRAADTVEQAAVQVAAYVKEYGAPSYFLRSDATGPQQLPGHLVFREDVADSEEDNDLAWLMSFERLI